MDDLNPAYSDSYPDSSSSSGNAPGLVPPQDRHAEQSVIGGMLLSKDAIADSAEAVNGRDFYFPAHEMIYEAVIDLYGRGEPADAITVADELSKRGELQRVGGQPYLHELIQSVPTAANAGYYAQIVAERAVLRRLVEAGTRIVQMGQSDGGGDVVDVINAAQAEIFGVTAGKDTEDYVRLGEVVEMTADEIEAASSHGGQMTGVPTGFQALDELTNGLHPGQMIVIAARPAVGKALALDTPLPTPSGWTTMGEVQVGDELIGADGLPTRVVAATEVMTDRPCFEVEFTDGTVIVADAQHQWLTDRHAVRGATEAAALAMPRLGAASGVRDDDMSTASPFVGAVSGECAGQATSESPAIRTTEELATDRLRWLSHGHELANDRVSEPATKEDAASHPKFSVRLTEPIDGSETDLLVAPYVLGAWLALSAAGQGFEHADGDLLVQLEAEADDLDAAVQQAEAFDPDAIPGIYLRASEPQRRALLAGLLDAGAEVNPDGGVRLLAGSGELGADVRELVASLGHRSVSATPTVIDVFADDDLFRVERKQLLHKEIRSIHALDWGRQFIVDVRPVPAVPVRCVEVDNQSHLYLASRSMIPTHNSTIGLDIARSASIKNNMASVIFSLEMGKVEISMRLLSAEAEIQLQHMRKGTMRDEDWAKLAKTMGRISDAPLFIDDSPNMSLMEIRSKCRRLKERHNLKLVVIDYLQLMTSGKKVESRQQEVSEFSRALKLLAKEIEVPVIAISQLNRGPEQRTDKRPQMSDLRESGSIEQDADMVMLLHREDQTNKESERVGEADIIVAKHRNGPTDTITVAFQGHYSRFRDMAQNF